MGEKKKNDEVPVYGRSVKESDPLLYREGIMRYGKNLAPNWLKETNLSNFVIPLLGGGYALFEIIFKRSGREQLIPYTRTILRLVLEGIGTATINAFKKK